MGTGTSLEGSGKRCQGTGNQKEEQELLGVVVGKPGRRLPSEHLWPLGAPEEG